MMMMPTLIDPFGRHVSYLRVSVTDRCDFRCVYCMAEDMTFLPKKDLLSLEELDRLCSAFIAKGVKKLRLTGGEPLVRKGIMTLVESLARHLRSGALEELTLKVRDHETTGTLGAGAGTGIGTSIVDGTPKSAPPGVRGSITEVSTTGSGLAQVNIGSDSGERGGSGHWSVILGTGLGVACGD